MTGPDRRAEQPRDVGDPHGEITPTSAPLINDINRAAADIPDPADVALTAETASVELTPHSRANTVALRVTGAIGTAAKVLCGLLLAVIVVVVSASVYARYVSGQPLVWVEDISLRAFVWMTFLGLVHLTERQTLLSLAVIANRLSGRPRLVLAMASGALAAYVFWIIFDWGRVVLVNVADTRSAALGLPGWTLYAAAPAAGLLCLTITAVQLSCLIEMTVRRQPR